MEKDEDEELAKRLMDVVRRGDRIALQKALDFMSADRRQFFLGYIDGYCDAMDDMRIARIADDSQED